MAEALLEASCLATVVLVPLCIDRNAVFMFEPPKAALLRAIAVVALVAWAIIGLCPAPPDPNKNVRWPASFSQLARTPLIVAVAMVALATALATALSISPVQSLWGFPGRARGLLTLLAGVTLFAATLSRLSSPRFLRRLLSALILPSIPLAAYALAQRLGYEVIQFSWRETEARRSMSLFGEPVFLAAYLDLVLPFTVMRAIEGWRGAGSRRARTWAAAIYGCTAALQMAAALASESRGALLGLIVAGCLALLACCARRGWRAPVIGLWTITACAAAAIALGVPAKLAGMRRAQDSHVVQRAAAAFAVGSSSGEFRKATWNSAAHILQRHEPLERVDGSRDRWASLRLLVGYGPETLGAVSPPSYDPKLQQFAYFLMDRAHNQLWDELITCGLLGLGSWLALQAALMWLIVSGLGLTASRARASGFWITYLGGALAGALTASALQGRAFCFLGLELGAALGLGVFLSAAALGGLASEADSATTAATPPHAGVLIAAQTALVAHVLEISFSFQVITTLALFYVVCALVLACAKDRVAAELEPVRSAPAVASASVRDALFDAALLAWVVGALSFALVGATESSSQLGSVVWDSLTRLDRPAGARAPVVLLVMFAALFGGGLLLLSERAAAGVSALAAHARVMFAGAFALSCASFLVFAAIRTELPVRVDTRQAFVPAGVEVCHHGWQALFAISALLLVLLVCTRPASTRALRPPTWPRALAACTCLLLGLVASVWLGLRPVQAEEAIAVGKSLQTAGELPTAAAVFQYADAVAPELGTGLTWLAKAERKRAEIDAGHAADALDRAERALRTAIARNPAAIDQATALAQLHAMLASIAATPQARAARMAEVSALFARTLRLHPHSAPALLAWAETQLLLFHDPKGALQSTERIPSQRRDSASHHALVGQALLALAPSQQEPARRRSTLAAAAAYARASELEPKTTSHCLTAANLYLELGMPERAAKTLRSALASLAEAAPERAAVLELLERARTEIALARTASPP